MQPSYSEDQVSGLLVWVYTGEWSVAQNVYDAATGAGGDSVKHNPVRHGLTAVTYVDPTPLSGTVDVLINGAIEGQTGSEMVASIAMEVAPGPSPKKMQSASNSMVPRTGQGPFGYPSGSSVAPARTPSASTNVINTPETIRSTPVKPESVIDEWDRFLGPGSHSNIHPRTGIVDPDRIVSADGKRSIRYGKHESAGKPTKHHYHEETWTYDSCTDTMTVDNCMVRAPYTK